MVMKIYQIITLLLYFTLGTLNANAATPAAPDPSTLTADWWTYLEPKEPLDSTALVERVAAIESLLKEYITKPATSGHTDYINLSQQITNDLNLFIKLKSEPLPASRLNIVPTDAYTVKESLLKYAFLQNLHQEMSNEAEDLDWQKLVIGEERKQESQLRNQYLDLSKTDSSRFGKGLELISSRLKVELKRLGFDRRKIILEQMKERVSQLQSELDVIPSRLSATPKEIEQWQNEYTLVLEKLNQLRSKSASDSLSTRPSISNFEDPAETKYLALNSIISEVDIGINELVLMQAQLALSLTQLINNPGNYNTDSSRTLLTDSQSMEERLRPQLKRFQRALEKIKDSTSIKITEDTAEQTKQKNINAKILSETLTAEQSLRRMNQEIEATNFLAEIFKKRQVTHEGWFSRFFTNTEMSISGITARTIDLFGATLFEVSETPVTALGIIRVILILTAAIWISKGLRRGIQTLGERRNAVSQSSLYTLGRVVHYTVLVIGTMIGLSSIGIDFTKFALFASALGVGIGFGLQTLISNSVAGLILLFERSLKVNDFVELESGVAGEVVEINMRSTLITTNDNIDIVVPNSEFISGRVTNWTMREAHRRIHVPFGVAYGTDKELVKKAVLEAAIAIPWTLMDKKTRHPQVWLVQFGDSSLNFELVVWLNPQAVKRPGAVLADYLWEIESKLNKYGIEIPFPQQDLHLRSVFGLKDSEAHALLPIKSKM
jgi:small-conductance mechanosensitive channel